MKWEISAQESGFKLQHFLKAKLGDQLSSKQIKKAIDKGQCRVNGRVERFASTQVGRGDQIVFEGEQIFRPEPYLIDRFLFSDDQIIAYDKPSGISSEDKKLLAMVEERFKNPILLHRLDRNTTGVLLFARTSAAAEFITQQFKERQIHKTYFALADGVFKESEGVIDNFLGKLHTYQGQTLWGSVTKDKGKRAYTVWKVKKQGIQAALVECFPETGRTHQLRVHLSGLGHPILGDYQYGRHFACLYRPARLMLHAAEIAFIHPTSQKRIKVSAHLPGDFQEAVGNVLGNSE